MAFCPQCGTPLSDGALFCKSCGARQLRPQAPEAPQNIPEPSTPYNMPDPSCAPQPSYSIPEPSYAPVTPPVQNASVPTQFPGTAVKAAKGGASILKWLIPLIAAALAVALVFVFLPNLFKSDETLIRERIQALEDAYNDGDYEGILECMDSQTQAMMEATMGMMDGLLGEASGLDMGISDMFGFASMLGDYCTIEITNIEIDGDYATVDIVMSLNLYGYSQSQETQLPMVKEDGDWYIGGMENFAGSDLSGLLSGI